MKPLVHPSMNDLSVEAILHALGDPVRVRIFLAMKSSECPQKCGEFLCVDKERTLPKSSLSQHMKVLRDAGLIRSERKGVEMHNVTRCEELKGSKYGPMIEGILRAYLGQMGINIADCK